LFKTRKKKLPWSNFFIAIVFNLLIIQVNAGDCEFMNIWLPENFSGAGIECCSQPGIQCEDDRITRMYVLYY
jgi:hypothetical protein